MPSSQGVEDSSTQQLFASVRYFIASSLSVQRADQLQHILDQNGAVYLEKGSLDTTLNTIITNSHRFEGWENVIKRGQVRVVSEKWVERSLILGKMQLAQYFSPDPAMIFSGIVACASDLPPADLEVLSAGITALGGQWRMGLTRDVTHLFALNPDSFKYATAMHYMEETGIRVVLPHWFDDAVRLGMGNLPTKPYEWPDPELLKGADGLIAEKENIKAKGKPALAELEQNDVKRNMYATAAIFTPTLGQSSPPTESDISLVLNKVVGPNNASPGLNLKQIQVWKGRKIILSRTLELYKGRREAVQVGIERAGGVVLRFKGDGDEPDLQDVEKLWKERIRLRNEAQKVADCDVLVTRWRNGRAYVSACQGGKTVGTLAWLFHVQSSGVLSNPQDQLLHYPVPKRNIEAFSRHVITVTNYTGETREYIKKLIAAMGATFTPSMSGENTVLIAAYLGGTKADKAQSWSIPIVNHTWLEDCFIQWRNLTMALEKYIFFPFGIDFSSLLGERGVGVGNQVMNEVEGLATIVFEEDEDYLSGDHGKGGAVIDDLVVDIPNEAEGSLKEVTRGLAAEVETEPVLVASTSSKPLSPKSMEKPEGFNPPEGMDIDFELPSTAVITANQMNWNVDVDLEEEHNTRLESPNDEEAEDPAILKKSAKISHKVARSKATIKTSHNGGEQVQEIIELDSGDGPPRQKMKGKKTRAKVVVASDEEDEEDNVMDEDHQPSKTTSNSKPKTVSTSVETRSGTRPANKAKAKATSISLPSDTGAPPKNSRKGTAFSSHISSKLKSGAKKSDHETDKESTADEKARTVLRRKLTVEVVMRSPFKGKKGKETQRSGDDKEPENVKAASVDLAPSGNKAAARSEGLLRKAKGDARTRIKRKPISKEGHSSVESEDEESPVQPRSTKRSYNGRQELTSKEQEDAQPSKTKPKMQPSASNNRNKAKPLVRSKPLRVYSSEDVESEDYETSTNVGDADVEGLGSEEELPETIIPPSRSRTKTTAASKVTTSRRREPGNKKRALVTKPSRRKGNKDTPSPERTVSVLSPSLAISGGPDEKRKKTHVGAHNLGGVHPSKKSKFQVQVPISDSEDVDEDEVNSIMSPRTRLGLSSTSVPRRASKADNMVEPMQVVDDRKSWSTPASASVASVTVPRRNAAAKAAQRLHETLMPDLVNYEAQLKKAKGKNRQSAGSLSAFALESEQEHDIGKRKKSVHSEEGGDEGDMEVQPAKKRRISNEGEDTIKVKRNRTQKAKEDSVKVEGIKPPSGVVLLTTQVTLPDDVLKSLARLGVRMTTRPSECTHLLCPHLVRTEKFLCALARAPFILSTKWATASATAKMLLPEREFVLKDSVGEKKFDVNLAQALRRAKANKGKLLEGKMFYLTPRVNVDKKLLKNVVNACGGDVTTQSPSLRIIRAAPENRHVISCKEDISIWRPIAIDGFKIYNQELLLAGIMKQQIEWDRDEFIVET